MIISGDCITEMQKLETASIDAAITDPPYNLGDFMKNRAHNLGNMRKNNFVDAGWDNTPREPWENLMRDSFRELGRVLRPRAALVVFMSAIKVETIVEIAQQAGFYYKTTGIWHKTNPMPRNMNLHYINSTESWIYFINSGRTGTFNNNGKPIHDFIETGLTPVSEKAFGKHPTQKPLALMRHFVRTLTNEGDSVLDPFAGSGTTLVAASELGRNPIGIELDQTYSEIALKRLAQIQPTMPGA